MEMIPSTPGSYALRLIVAAPARLTIGRLGEFSFPAGNYLYLGSAHGPGGLRARLRHHARPVEHPHWHIDWLRAVAVWSGGWFTTSPGQIECLWSQALLSLPGAALPVPGFGAADCRQGCAAHLLFLPQGLDPEIVEQALSAAAPVYKIE